MCTGIRIRSLLTLAQAQFERTYEMAVDTIEVARTSAKRLRAEIRTERSARPGEKCELLAVHSPFALNS